MIPTKEEYLAAKKITGAYEREQRRLHLLNVDAFKLDLEKYFSENLLDGKYKIKKFALETDYENGLFIIPQEPYLESCYEGGNNMDIDLIAEKYDVSVQFPNWMYHQ